MSKRLFNVTPRAEYVLEHYKEAGGNLSAIISDAVINYELPQYGTLHNEALYLLDSVTNGLEDWRRPNGSRAVPKDPADEALNAIRAAVTWLRNNHVKNNYVLRQISRHFEASSAGVNITELPPHMQDRLIQYNQKLIEMGCAGMGIHVCIGWLFDDIMNHWESLWDDPVTYEVLIDIVYLEKVRIPFDPFDTISLMRMLEQTYISENIKE